LPGWFLLWWRFGIDYTKDKEIENILHWTLMAALGAFLSEYQWGCDFVIRIAPGMKNVVSFAQLSCDLRNMRLIFAKDCATNTSGVEKHPRFCRRHRKTCSVLWYFAR